MYQASSAGLFTLHGLMRHSAHAQYEDESRTKRDREATVDYVL